MYSGFRDCVSVAKTTFYPSHFLPVPVAGWKLWAVFPNQYGKPEQPQPNKWLKTSLLVWDKPRMRNQLFSLHFSSSNMSRRVLPGGAGCIHHSVRGDNFAGCVSIPPAAKNLRNLLCLWLLAHWSESGFSSGSEAQRSLWAKADLAQGMMAFAGLV